MRERPALGSGLSGVVALLGSAIRIGKGNAIACVSVADLRIDAVRFRCDIASGEILFGDREHERKPKQSIGSSSRNALVYKGS